MLTEALAGEGRMLTRKEVRSRLGIGKDKYLDLVRSGELAAIRTGTAPNSPYRVSEAALADFIERNRVRPAGVAS